MAASSGRSRSCGEDEADLEASTSTSPLLPPPMPSSNPTGGWTSTFFIIGVEIAERFAYYGIASNLITYVTGPLGKTTAAAAASVNAWSGTASMLPLVGGLVADSWLGRYRTILVASGLYLLGLSILTLSAIAPHLLQHHRNCEHAKTADCNHVDTHVAELFFFFAIYSVALAQGCHKPCSQAFAADQFDETDPKESISKQSLFNWWYCAMCIGTTAAILILTYVQDNIGWGLGFGIPCISMVIALVLFLLGSKTYRYHPINRYNVVLGGEGNPTALRGDHPCTTYQSSPANVAEPIPSPGDDKYDNMWSEAKGLLGLFPIWATCLVYAVIFSQTTTLFTKQGATMDGRIGQHFKVPPAALLTFISFTIVICIPIYDRFFVPYARNITGIPSGITMLQRIGTGQFLSIVSMVAAALVEIKRLKTARDFGLVDKLDVPIPMSLWWLVPQYMIFGIADVFTIIGMQEFFYDQVPEALRSFGVALYLSVLGIGSFISSLLITIIDKVSIRSGESWFSDNLNRAHIDYFYWLLALLSGLEFTLFVYFARSYRYKRKGSIAAC